MTYTLNPEEYLQALHLLAERNTAQAGPEELAACYYEQQIESLDCLEPTDLMAELERVGIRVEDL